MRASLPMYDLPAVVGATDAWWTGVARHLRAAGIACVPDQLTRGSEPMSDWLAPDLVLSQTCGYPLIHALADAVHIVATPRYHAPGSQGPNHASLLVVPEHGEARSLGELAGGVAVVNSLDSQSGCHALRYMVAKLADCRFPFFSRVRISGSHVASIKAVAAGEADVAAVDAITHALLKRHTPGTLADTRLVDVSPPMPGLPYITRSQASIEYIERLRTGLLAAADDPELAWARQALMIDGFDILSRRDYASIIDMENQVDQAGLPAWNSR